MFDVITIGDCAQDIFVKPVADHFSHDQIGLRGKNLYLRHGDKIATEEVRYEMGGCAANVAVGLARQGLKISTRAIIGKDQTANRILQQLQDASVDCSNIKIDAKNPSNTSVIIVYNQERTIFVYRSKFDYKKIKITKDMSCKWIYLGPVAKEFSINYSKLIALASEKNINIAINPGDRQIVESRNELAKLLRVTNLLIVNKEEAKNIIGDIAMNEKKMLDNLKRLGPKIVVITNGKDGAYASIDQEYFGIKSYPVEVLDPTGAGDAFSSGFLASYIKNHDMREALQFGILNSAMVIEKFGAQTNLQTTSQLKNLLKFSPKLYKL